MAIWSELVQQENDEFVQQHMVCFSTMAKNAINALVSAKND